jgi:replicative DNA helicase
MRAKARRLAAEQKKLDLIIVDYLAVNVGFVKAGGVAAAGSVADFARVERISEGVECAAARLVAAFSCTRISFDHRPQLADLRESGALEQDADLVAFIFREEQYKTPEERDAMPEEQKNIAEIIIAKQRNGPTGTVDLRFTPSSMRFDNLYRE